MTPTEGSWTEVDAPVTDPLVDVVRTADGACAVGGNGRVLYRDGGDWRVAVPSGPGASGYGLTCAAVTGDGERVWFAGQSGALGAYDAPEGRKCDHSAPKEMTSTWTAITVAGPRNDESVRVANGSGEVLDGSVDEDGCVTWGEAVKPGGGSSIAAGTADAAGNHYFVDTNANAFRSSGDGWETIGVSNAQGAFSDVAADGASSGDAEATSSGGQSESDGSTVLITDEQGIVYRFDAACMRWTPAEAASGALRGCDVAGDRRIAVGDAGVVAERVSRSGWVQTETPASGDFHAVALGTVDVAVGSSGTILERGGSG